MIKKFSDFIKEADADKDADFKVKFSSPLYVQVQWPDFWEKQMQDRGPKEFNDKAKELGWDFSDAFNDWQDGKDDDQFWDAVNKIINPKPVAGKYDSGKEKLTDTSIEVGDIEDIVIDDFNGVELAKYAKEKVPTLTKLEALEVDKAGNIIVEATYSEAPNEDVLEKTKSYLMGQYSDGWGEGFEQQEQEGKDEDQPAFYINAWAGDKDKHWKITVVKNEEH